MLSQTAEYALRVIVYLAAQEGGHSRTNQQIAAATQVPIGYLAKLMQSLGRAEMVDSQRGLHGGFVLSRPAEELSVYDVIQAVASVQRIRGCPLGLAAHKGELCPLHRKLDEAMAMVEDAFRNSSIADLLTEPTHSKPLCDFPNEKPKKKAGRKVTA